MVLSSPRLFVSPSGRYSMARCLAQVPVSRATPSWCRCGLKRTHLCMKAACALPDLIAARTPLTILSTSFSATNLSSIFKRC